MIRDSQKQSHVGERERERERERDQASPKHSRNSETFEKCCWTSQASGIQKLENVGKDGCRTIPMIRLISSSKSGIWDQYLSKNMK